MAKDLEKFEDVKMKKTQPLESKKPAEKRKASSLWDDHDVDIEKKEKQPSLSLE